MKVELISVTAGEVTAEMKLTPELTQQHGVAHAGTIAALADIVCGLSAYSLMADGLSFDVKVDAHALRTLERIGGDIGATLAYHGQCVSLL